jgi:hypothetical protein
VLESDDHHDVDRMITDMQRRQAEEAPPELALPFDRYPDATVPGTASRALTARGQIVVRVDRFRSGPAATVRADGSDGGVDANILTAVRNLRYEQVARTPVAPPRDPNIRVFQAASTTIPAGAAAPPTPVEAVRILRGQNIDAAMHLVVPLGHLIKGDDYPSVTERPTNRLISGTFRRDPQAKVRVAVIDTGIDPITRGDGFLVTVPRGPDRDDRLDVLPAPDGDGMLDLCAGHGSFAAGIVQRVCPDCEIVVYRFTRTDGLGTEADVADMLLRAVDDAEQAGTQLIINASLGTPAVDGAPPLALGSAIERINRLHPKVLIVASAGNLGTDDMMYPAAFDRVVAVGALDDSMRPARFSNHGPWVDCSAVGVGVTSTFVRGMEPSTNGQPVEFGLDSWGIWSGTSFSAPQIAGAVARRCLEDSTIDPQRAIDDLFAGQAVLDGYGHVFRLLSGTTV